MIKKCLPRGEEVKKENLKIVLAGRQAGKKKGGEKGCTKRRDDVERRNDGEEKGESGGPGAEPPEKFLGPRPFLECHALFQIQGNALFYFRATPLY